MNKETVENLYKINKKFYEENAESFNLSRQYYWDGWFSLIKFFNVNNIINILDIGCGNGRFADFLLENLKVKNFDYLGVDNSEKLIKIAIEKFSNYTYITFCQKDIYEINSIVNNYIVIFGLMHHIPGKDNRFKFLANIFNLIPIKATIFISFWNFRNSINSKSFQYSKEFISKYNIKMEKNDYLLKWQNSEYPRYCHYFCEDEIIEIKELINKNKIKIKDEFYSDGKSKDSNLYFVLSK